MYVHFFNVAYYQLCILLIIFQSCLFYHRYDHIFCVFCFYGPYYRHTDGIVFKYGEPASHCPPQYPLKDLIYPTLCTRNLYLDVDEENHAAGKIELSDGVLIFILLQFLCIN